LIAGNAGTCCLCDVLNDGLVEIFPDSYWDHKAREHGVDDGQIRIRIIERCAIDGGSIHDIFNADSPASIIFYLI
jgi:hypothetical protein